MRDIKFRYRLRLISDDWGLYKGGDIGTFYMTLNCDKNGISRFGIDERWEIISCEEYTGLKDKNGKEIYEGDTLMGWVETDEGFLKGDFPVFWNEKTGSWQLDNSYYSNRASSIHLWEGLSKHNLEITGNIHDNPPLTNN
ncbi:YopX family protein [Aquimarina intermedia]|uniref:Putative phage protein (TIGR01671 family) n=1 Tax=Aquimarina intermedia TaxID=350814 RepID=A0A5S5BZ68_9FLAO|nr:YopX family protein [Aquimarina intermedia]TYP71506.1 putative phage protein (TIGR01671 family) [Aquimarina intermedia]